MLEKVFVYCPVGLLKVQKVEAHMVLPAGFILVAIPMLEFFIYLPRLMLDVRDHAIRLRQVVTNYFNGLKFTFIVTDAWLHFKVLTLLLCDMSRS